jgi:hypothetical protein
MKICVDGKYIDVVLTPEEIAELENLTKIEAVKEKHRPLTEAEVNSMLIRQQVNTLEVDDVTALRMKSLYPTFESISGQTVQKDYKFTYGGKLWRVIQPSLTIQAHYAPGVGTESLYEEINGTHDGDPDDPIPYNGNMALTKGLYYYQDGAIYLCTRDTVNPVYNPLAELVGLYVEVY